VSREISLIFPGQGSQHAGMLDSTLISKYKDLISNSSDLLKFNIIDILSSDEKLNQTSYTQPSLLLTSYIHFLEFAEINSNPLKYVAGHSLGEYTALVASEAINFYDGLELVYKRGNLMESAPKGLMAAIIGLEVDAIIDLCAHDQNKHNSIVSAANINSPIQTVIAGDPEAVERVCDLAKTGGAKRAIILNVSVPSHCMLMTGPALKFNDCLDTINISKPKINLIQNFTGNLENTPSKIKSNLINQLTNSVQWTLTMQVIKDSDSMVVECGPGKVLSGIAKSNKVIDTLSTSSDNFKDMLSKINE